MTLIMHRDFLSCVFIALEGVNEQRETKSQRFSDFSKENTENPKGNSKASVVFPTRALFSNESRLTLNHGVIFV